MLVRDGKDLRILVCPACRNQITLSGPSPSCINPDCRLNGEAFATADGRPVLVDFSRSILQKSVFGPSSGSSLVPRGGRWREVLNRVANGTNKVAPYFAHEIISRLEQTTAAGDGRPIVLIVGGGAVGSGSDELYISKDVDVISFDIYASDNVTFIADGHSMPIVDESVDAVWIQAVLEHVTDPSTVVKEIHRVLKPGGHVFADTPFMWPVHEKAYDYTRYTPSGHRWLFRDFDVLAAGTSSGPGTNLLLAIRYLAASLSRSSKVGHLVSLPFFWVRFLDDFCDRRRGLDAAAGLFFFGKKNVSPLGYQGLVSFYDDQIRLQSEVPRFRRFRKNALAS